ncbi:hypothetical protein CBS147355_8586 [Penicillium roqueforti]|nr:hypothetical protein CBS147355_8586 [Penicillium roqueforti]
MISVLDTSAPTLSEVSKGRTEEQALYLGSAKANIGHGGASSGVSALIKFLTDLGERNVNIALKPTVWERSTDPSRPRRVFVNNFSAAVGNSVLLIEDAPVQK